MDFTFEIANRFNKNTSEGSLSRQEALLEKLDLSRFEHAYFLTQLSQMTGPESPSPKVDGALGSLNWPEVPGSWAPDECAEAFHEALTNRFTVALPRGLASAKRGLAKRLWTEVSKRPGIQASLEAANRTPVKAILEALTAEFDLRVAIVARGTDEIPECDAGTNETGRAIRAQAYKELENRAERTVSRLFPEMFGKLGVGFRPSCGSGLKDTPATLEVRFEATRTDKLYSHFTTYATGVSLTATVTLTAGRQTWTSKKSTHVPDEKIYFNADTRDLSGAIFENVLEKLIRELEAELVRRE